ncbi:NAD(P)-linked oxidoreductase superfamily protein [Striga asiatica]|uniref:NAD(P)-linked oxidoreductase superfamily protein n=1 Tax=Striga asiatica TaxID=4170 RepID=A0A5A7PTR5_STRAF|nr:NAD(P)-linked oxidoreductase superfamily protein [Striga asiatica]
MENQTECETSSGDRENPPFGKKNREEGRASPRSSPAGSSSSSRDPRKLLKRDVHNPSRECHSPINPDSDPSIMEVIRNTEKSDAIPHLLPEENYLMVAKMMKCEKSVQTDQEVDMLKELEGQTTPSKSTTGVRIIPDFQPVTKMIQKEDGKRSMISPERRPKKWSRLDSRDNRSDSENICNTPEGYINCVIVEDNRCWRFTGFYGDPKTADRKFSWELLRKLHQQVDICHLRWLTPVFCSKDALREVLDFCELRTIFSEGDPFTWVNRFVGTSTWCDLYPAARACNLEFFGSNHKPIEITLGERTRLVIRGKVFFRFKSCWLSEENFGSFVKEGWRMADTSCPITTKLATCSDFITAWAGSSGFLLYLRKDWRRLSDF